MPPVAPAGDRARTRDLVVASLIAALLAASAYFVAPVQPVPITLQVLFVVLAALLLPAKWASAAVAVYLALGAAGVPVFSGGKAGLGVIAGPTGGYLIGFLMAAAAGSLVRSLLERRTAQTVADVAGSLVAVIVIYVVGTVQLAVVAKLAPAQAVIAGVVPFIVPDVAKALVAVVAARALRKTRRD